MYGIYSSYIHVILCIFTNIVQQNDPVMSYNTAKDGQAPEFPEDSDLPSIVTGADFWDCFFGVNKQKGKKFGSEKMDGKCQCHTLIHI